MDSPNKYLDSIVCKDGNGMIADDATHRGKSDGSSGGVLCEWCERRMPTKFEEKILLYCY